MKETRHSSLLAQNIHRIARIILWVCVNRTLLESCVNPSPSGNWLNTKMLVFLSWRYTYSTTTIWQDLWLKEPKLQVCIYMKSGNITYRSTLGVRTLRTQDILALVSKCLVDTSAPVQKNWDTSAPVPNYLGHFGTTNTWFLMRNRPT